MGSVAPPVGPFAAAIHSPTLDALVEVSDLAAAVVYMVETIDQAPGDEYAIGTVRDARGVLIAASDSLGRCWTCWESPAATVASWSGSTARAPRRRRGVMPATSWKHSRL